MQILSWKVNEGGRFTGADSVYILFDEGRYVEIAGDWGQGKTTLETLLLMGLARLGGEELIKQYVNKKSGKLDQEIVIRGNDRCVYTIRQTKSQFILEYDGEQQPEPATKVRELTGAVGFSPMPIKNAKFSEQVKWLSAYTLKGQEECEKELTRIKNGIKASKDARATAGKQYKAIKAVLLENDLFLNWEQSERKFAKKPTLEAISKRLDEVGKRSDNLIKAKEKVKGLKAREKELLEQLALVQADLAKGETYIENNKGAEAEYTQVRAEYDNIAKTAAEYAQWQEVKRQKVEMDEYETLYQKADAQEKEFLAERKLLEAELIPDIKGAEVLLEPEYKDGKIVREEGLYYNGFSLPQLSETEFWEFVMKIWQKNKVKVVVIDNFGQLGTAAVEMVEKLRKAGAYIIVTTMKRGAQKIEITQK